MHVVPFMMLLFPRNLKPWPGPSTARERQQQDERKEDTISTYVVVMTNLADFKTDLVA